jgi:hypothetical protein
VLCGKIIAYYIYGLINEAVELSLILIYCEDNRWCSTAALNSVLPRILSNIVV